jgi:hypothetical protein
VHRYFGDRLRDISVNRWAALEQLAPWSGSLRVLLPAMDEPRAYYEARLVALRERLEQAETRSNRVSLGRVGSFLLGAAAGVAYLTQREAATLAVGVGMGVVFVGLVLWHIRVELEVDRLRSAVLFTERGLNRVKGEVGSLPERGARLRVVGHPYAGDLDLLGKRSLLELLDSMETEPSEERLARWLLAPASIPEVRARQTAVKELAGNPSLREALFVRSRSVSRGEKMQGAFVGWCRGERRVGPPALLAAAIVLPLITLTLLVAGGALGLPERSWMLVAGAQWMLSLAVASRGAEALGAAERGARALGAFGAVIGGLGEAKLTAPRLAELQGKLAGEAAAGLGRLDTLAGWAEARESALVRLVIGPLFLFDLHLVLALERWRARHGAQVEGWIDAMADTLSLAGLGTYAFENQDFCYPELIEGPLRYEAEGLCHPLLPRDARVSNDVRFDGPGTALLVTGSNMSGKSTLMRAIGLSAVLAQAGAPVPAGALRISPLGLRTSIRISDSLASGYSHFYAEILALKRVVDDAAHGPVLFLLDEILHGTNSAERQTGAKAVISHLLKEGAMGAVTTHDLGLTELIDELPGQIRPVHLLEQTEGDAMRFDYKLRDGVLRSGNALRLMRQLGLPV